ncbi:peptidase C19 family protein [Cavenderia fasciculata]|uniref:ubiquitinyl hydrolase 1 n=1 Tax=Cavenderia fasciculata TaxID=261658 RepID=F4PWQ3_CACFS|nr:peptidase C19 family protein [Cavenderia fasciculata]EGG20417.1 peptidase C19 family protein [Cavenderia fasciculata]|eukprot:XP_004367400.1 peptidase C19 family protein [Cavenderia fasciculata]
MDSDNNNNNNSQQLRRTISVLDEETDRCNRRKLVLQEILNTEISYYNHLDILIKNYIEPCLVEKVLNKDDMMIVFNNAVDVKDQSKRFLNALETSLGVDLENGMNYALAFSSTFRLEIFITYIVGYERALTRLRDIRQKNKSFVRFLEKRRNSGLDPGSNTLGLESYLVMPVGRCPRYMLLFQELCKLTPITHPHYQSIVDTMASLQKNLEDINRHLHPEINNTNNNNNNNNKKKIINNNNDNDQIDDDNNDRPLIVDKDNNNNDSEVVVGDNNNNNNNNNSKCMVIKREQFEEEKMTESPAVNSHSAESNSFDSPSAGFENMSSTTDSSFVEINSTSSAGSSPSLSSTSVPNNNNGIGQVEESSNMSLEKDSVAPAGPSNGVVVSNDGDATVATDSNGTNNNNNNNNNNKTPTTTTTVVAEDNEYANLTEDERKKINNDTKDIIKRAPLIVGESWFLINYEWYDKWLKNIFSPDELGPINNSNLLVPGTEFIKPGQTENTHFAVVPAQVWNYFLKSYGCSPIVSRKVAKNFMSSSIDYNYPVPLKVFKSSQQSNVLDIFASKNETVNKFKERVCKLLDVEPQNVRVWDYYNHSKYNELKNPEYISNCRLIEGQNVLFDERLADGSWPQEKSSSSYSGYSSRYNQRNGPARPGIAGLDNLGNTCFMNSSLQCLSNAIPLTRYLLNEKHLEDLNVDNPLGCNGDLAKEYANLIKQIWKGDMTSVGPRNFKTAIERFAPQFMGYQQHDSQELLAFLLDGLHEDMNQVKKKPFFEGKDYDGRADEIIANEQWEMHRARNKSIIVDWFQAQLKSKLICPECENISITFDPFMYLSLPLPVNIRKIMSVVYVPYNGNALPTQHSIELNKSSTVQELLEKLAAEPNVAPISHLFATSQSNNQINKHLKPTGTLDSIHNRDPIVVYVNHRINRLIYEQYELKDPANHTIKVTMKTGYHSHFPFVLSVPFAELTSVEDLYFHIQERLGGLLKEQDRIKEIFDSNQKPIENEPSEEEEDNSYSGYRPYNYNRINHQKPARDPRFIFQMTVDNKDSMMAPPKKFAFDPINFDMITLHWEGQTFDRHFDAGQLENSQYNTFHRDIASEKEIELKTCIDLFTSTEKLGAEDPWYCSKCKVHQQATKKFDIWSAPPILVIHLKRFSYKKAWREKLDTLVRFPIKDLDLSSHVLSPSDSPPVYDLFAVSNHYGSMGGGHYTAYALNELENQWVKFDDSHTQNVDASNVITDAAYVLFYRRKDTYSPDFHLNKGLKEVKDITTEMNSSNGNGNGENSNGGGGNSPNGYESSSSNSAWNGGSGYSGRSSAVSSTNLQSAPTTSTFASSRAQAATSSSTSTTSTSTNNNTRGQSAIPTTSNGSNDTGSADIEVDVEPLPEGTDQPLMEVD